MVMLWQRMKRVVTASAHAQVDNLEDPAQMMNQILREQVVSVKRGKAAVKRAELFRRQIEARIWAEQKTIDTSRELAEAALADGLQERARPAIRRKQMGEQRLEELRLQLERATKMEEHQRRVSDKLRGDLEALRDKRRVIVQRAWLQRGLRDIHDLELGAEAHEEVVERMEEKTLLADASLDAMLNLDEERELDLNAYASERAVEQELAAMMAEQAKGATS